MKKEIQTAKFQRDNPYQKIFDDAHRLIKKLDDMEFLDEIPENLNHEPPSIPFPYGNKSARRYNFNSN